MQMNSAIVSNNKGNGCKINTTTIKQQQKFQCRAQDFYNAFTVPEVKILFFLYKIFLSISFAI